MKPLAIDLFCGLGGWTEGLLAEGQGPRNHGSKSKARKQASAMIAKIPLSLSSHIARIYRPEPQS